jgi:hypothetical protein
MAHPFFTRGFWIEKIVPLSMGALLGAVLAGAAFHWLVQDCRVWGFTLDPQTWWSAVLSVVSGAFLSWYLTWAYARKTDSDLKAIRQTVERIRSTNPKATNAELILSVLEQNPKLTRTAVAGLVKLFGFFQDIAVAPADSNGTTVAKDAAPPAKQL